MNATTLQISNGGERVDFTFCRDCDTCGACLSRQACFEKVPDERVTPESFGLALWVAVLVLAVLSAFALLGAGAYVIATLKGMM